MHWLQTDDVVPAGITHCVQLLPHWHVFGKVSLVWLDMHDVAVTLYKHLRLKLPVPFVYVPAGQTVEHTPPYK